MTTSLLNLAAAECSVASRSSWRLVAAGNVVPRAFGQDVSFDFARLVEYRDVTPAEQARPRDRTSGSSK